MKSKKELLSASATLVSLSISNSLMALSSLLMHVRNFPLFFTELASSLWWCHLASRYYLPTPPSLCHLPATSTLFFMASTRVIYGTMLKAGYGINIQKYFSKVRDRSLLRNPPLLINTISLCIEIPMLFKSWLLFFLTLAVTLCWCNEF